MRKRNLISVVLLLILNLLGIQAQEPNKANYDENKIPPYTLPELLKMSNGQKVTTVQQWEQIRRPEL